MQDTSITGRAYQLLRARIIGCELRPGSRLNIASLQMSLSLSQASVREALSRLTAEGLVEIERHRGFRVAPVSASGFRELGEACLTVELPCLRSAIANGDLEWERNLIATHHRAVRTLEQVVAGKEGVDAYFRERLAFYEALLGPCDNLWLLWSWRLLHAQNLRYRHMYLSLAKFEHELQPKHKKILDLVLKRETVKVEALVIANYAEVSTFLEGEMQSEEAGRAGTLGKQRTSRRPLEVAQPALPGS